MPTIMNFFIDFLEDRDTVITYLHSAENTQDKARERNSKALFIKMVMRNCINSKSYSPQKTVVHVYCFETIIGLPKQLKICEQQT